MPISERSTPKAMSSIKSSKIIHKSGSTATPMTPQLTDPPIPNIPNRKIRLPTPKNSLPKQSPETGNNKELMDYNNMHKSESSLIFDENPIAVRERANEKHITQKVYDTIDFKLPSTTFATPHTITPPNYIKNNTNTNLKKKKWELEVERLIQYIKTCKYIYNIQYIYIYI